MTMISRTQDLGVALVDDRLVAVGAGDHVRLYDRETLAPTRTIPLEGDVASLDIVVDGQGGIVTTGWEGTTRVDLATGEILWRRFVDPTRNCESLHLATDTTLACGSYEGVALIDLATGETRDAPAALHLDEFPRFETIDDESLLVSVHATSLWMRWRIDGGGAGSDVVAKGQRTRGRPGSRRIARRHPACRGRTACSLWDLERDAPVGEEADLIVPLGSGVVARYARYDPDAESGEPRLERLSTGEEIPLRIPGLPDSFNVLPGAWGVPHSPGGGMASSPSTRRRASLWDLS